MCTIVAIFCAFPITKKCAVVVTTYKYVKSKEIKHIRGKPNHPQTQGKIERYHRSMKNIVKLENYNYPDQLKERLSEFVDYYNNRRYHESLQNLTPADVYFGRGERILKQRQIIKMNTMKERRRTHLSQVLIN